MRTMSINTSHDVDLRKLLRFGRTIKLNLDVVEQFFDIDKNNGAELLNKLEQQNFVKKVYDSKCQQLWINTPKGDYMTMTREPADIIEFWV